MFSHETPHGNNRNGDNNRPIVVQAETKKQNKKIGNLGEDIFVKHLVKHKYHILDRNYRKNWGEIDIVATKHDIIHFFEVKTVRANGIFDTFHMKPRVKAKCCSVCVHQDKIIDKNIKCCWKSRCIPDEKSAMSYCGHNVAPFDTYDPLENVHMWKRRRFAKAIETYLAEKNVSRETNFQINAGAVFLDFKNKKAKIRVIEDIDLS